MPTSAPPTAARSWPALPSRRRWRTDAPGRHPCRPGTPTRCSASRQRQWWRGNRQRRTRPACRL
ncbi:hypothetical protein AAY81_03960 [Denitrobacterium detoxificans]|nr:hypothetical protein AAY81_03960 [Denitrobacterium detoxificans]